MSIATRRDRWVSREASVGVRRGGIAMPGRGFALPLVLMMSVAVSLLIAVMLERQMAQRLTIARQVEAYQRHHTAKGMQEIIDSWIRSVSGRALSSTLVEGVPVLTLTLSDGSIAEVTFRDAQGTVLSSAAGLLGRDAREALAIRAALPRGTRAANLPPLTRDVGPLAVSVRTAPPEVIEAVFTAIGGSSGAREFAQRLVDARTSKTLEQSDISRTAITLGVPGEVRSRLNELLVPEPSLWFVTIEFRSGRSGGSPGRVLAREGGHIVVQSRRPGRASAGAIWEKSSAFLTWQKLPIQ